MTAAIFGLLGVIVGGVLNGLVSAALQRRTQKSDSRAATRLVRSELTFFLAAAQRVASTNPDELPQLRKATTDLWQNNRSVLARSLSPDHWARVALSYAHVDALLSLLVFEPDGSLAQWRIEEAVPCCEEMVGPLREAVKALGGDPIEEDEDVPDEDEDSDRPDRPPVRSRRRREGLRPDQLRR